jgi:beta-phosphoglucomutase-like phosphatase (HAD superfamily)
MSKKGRSRVQEISFSGRVFTGLGEGAAFTTLDWARAQFRSLLGIDPYPGTLNLLLERPADRRAWARLRAKPGKLVAAPDPTWCNARCYPVRIGDRFPGAIVLPLLPGYPQTQVEVIAALPLRERLGAHDGDRISLAASRPLAVAAAIFDADGTLVDGRGKHQLLPGVREAVEQLRERGILLGIATELAREALEPLHAADLMGSFSAVVTAAKASPAGSESGNLSACAATLGVRLEQAASVTAAPMRVLISRAAGMPTVAILRRMGDSARLAAEGPDWVVSSIARLPEILGGGEAETL